MPANDDDPLIDLQVRYTHLEKLVSQLNEVVTEQQSELERFARQLKAMREELQGGSGNGEGEEPPPPHY